MPTTIKDDHFNVLATFDGRKLIDPHFKTIATFDGKKLQDPHFKTLLTFDGKDIKNAKLQKIASFDGKTLKDNHFKLFVHLTAVFLRMLDLKFSPKPTDTLISQSLLIC